MQSIWMKNVTLKDHECSEFESSKVRKELWMNKMQFCKWILRYLLTWNSGSYKCIEKFDRKLEVDENRNKLHVSKKFATKNFKS